MHFIQNSPLTLVEYRHISEMAFVPVIDTVTVVILSVILSLSVQIIAGYSCCQADCPNPLEFARPNNLIVIKNEHSNLGVLTFQ